MTDKLLSCPFCGDEMSSFVPSADGCARGPGLLYVTCDCGAMGAGGKTVVDAIAAWNRRSDAQLRRYAEETVRLEREAMDALLRDLRWRMDDIRDMLMKEGIGGNRIYGCDEWSTPTVNLQRAIDKIDAAIRARSEVIDDSASPIN